MAQPWELPVDSHPGLPGQAASLMKAKMPPYAFSLLGSAAHFPSPAHAEGLFVPHKHPAWLSVPCPDPLQPAETTDVGSWM